MKKIAALMLVLVMALSVSLTAFAETELDLVKVWNDETGAEITGESCPDVEIRLISAGDRWCENNSHEAYGMYESLPEITVVKAAGSDTFVISGDESIEGVGHFFYAVKEEALDYEGVTADETIYVIEILRTYVEDPQNPGVFTTDIETQYMVSLYDEQTGEGSADKVTEIINVYEDGELTIDKIVTGNLSNDRDEFEVTVTLTADKDIANGVVITLPDQKTITNADFEGGVYTTVLTITGATPALTFSGIPAGVEVTVEETDCGTYTIDSYEANGVSSSDAPSVEMTAEGVEVVITNLYETELKTGVALDSIPYIIVLAVVAGAAVFFTMKKRQNAMDID